MDREKFKIIAEKATQESGERMLKEMTDNPIKRLMFKIAKKWWPI